MTDNIYNSPASELTDEPIPSGPFVKTLLLISKIGVFITIFFSTCYILNQTFTNPLKLKRDTLIKENYQLENRTSRQRSMVNLYTQYEKQVNEINTEIIQLEKLFSETDLITELATRTDLKNIEIQNSTKHSDTILTTHTYTITTNSNFQNLITLLNNIIQVEPTAKIEELELSAPNNHSHLNSTIRLITHQYKDVNYE